MKRVLVTGASGFIGKRAVEHLLARGYEVHATGRRDLERPGVAFHRADLLAANAAAAVVAAVRPTHLLHLAWCVERGKFWTSIENLSWVGASLALFRNFIESGGMRAAFAGSCAEYEWTDTVLSEAETPSRAASLYGTSKNALREIVDAAATQSGISTAWGRMFFVYGPNEPPGRLVSHTIQAVTTGAPIEIIGPHRVRDFLYVEDVAEALVALLDSDVTGTVNIGSGVPVSIRTIVETVARLAGLGDPVIEVRPSLTEEPAWLVADVSRLRDVVGFMSRYDLETGLAMTLAAAGGAPVAERTGLARGQTGADKVAAASQRGPGRI